MLNQTDIFALDPQIDSLLTTSQSELSEINKQIEGETVDYTSPEYISAFKKQRKLETKIEGLKTLKKLIKGFQEANDIVFEGTADNDFIELAKEELGSLPPKITDLYEKFMQEEEKFSNVVMEIRSGAGGEEASLFAQEVYRMYTQFAAEKGWKAQITDSEVSEKGGFKHMSAYIEGDDAYFWLQHESGVHRVQRVPATESSGRIHTSTISVAILPEVEEDDVEVDPKDIEMEAFRASGPGGQYVNKTSTAVRLRHIPTGVVVASQEQRSQLKNREAAMRMLKSKIYQAQEEAKVKELGDLRRSQIGTGDRSEKIRTYNFPQSRVTDHRVKKSWFNITDIMDGKIEDLLTDVRKLMKEQENSEN